MDDSNVAPPHVIVRNLFEMLDPALVEPTQSLPPLTATGDDDGNGPYLDKHVDDPNAYSMGPHAGHGQGQRGFRTRFPSIKLALVVGICGAVPFYTHGGETNEILLGDVVVSDGLVQYDLAPWLLEERDIRNSWARPMRSSSTC
ncbi:hypothetical protein B0T24DRAFT_676015 [Lasiosphaeria ovina]|uniref:Nucleoside phosphorylase domain-containing protein n=1 Tax=Lasiosphaeria ovina TaxID=92902 RepID=A0AAE0NF18_9PEZI|nr:hypothetical protein B0T24DRAFT_676015 [Lasiosphaeria ovina]